MSRSIRASFLYHQTNPATPVETRNQLPEKCRFLAKPYRHDHVIRHIRELAA
jgi:hypothetical protein